MVDLAPFRGLRFQPDVVGDVANVTAPPYDAIDPATQARLYAASPFNVVRLELGQELPHDDARDNRYSRAAAEYARWLADGVLTPDPSPALYVYEQTFRRGAAVRTQVGVVGALRVTPWDRGEVLPHERVFREPVEDRKRLLAALPANISPVFVLTARTDPTVARVLDQSRARDALAAFTDADGVGHRLWAVTDPIEHGHVAQALQPQHALMADGHHRYTTAVEHHHQRPGPGTDRVLAFVVGADRGPAIDASHRLVRRLPADALQRLTDLGVDVQPTDLGPSALATMLADAAEATFGWVTPDGAHILRTDRARLAHLVRHVPPPVRDLDITLLQQLLLGPLGIPDRMEDLRYTSDVADAVGRVRDASHDGLFLVRPVTFAQFQAACEARVLMPPKSTTFVPKPRTGLVIRPLAAAVRAARGDTGA